MGSIRNFLVDKLQAKIGETLVEDTVARLRQRTGFLDRFMPIKTYEDDEFLAYVTERLTPIASLIAPGNEPPVTGHGNFRRMIGELAKIGLSYQFDEVTQKRMQKAMEEATYKNVSVMSMTLTDNTVIKGTNDRLVKYLYGHVEGLVQAHADRLTSMAWEVVQTGQLNIVDQRTKVKTIVDFRRPNAPYNHFPTALVNTGNTADRKSNIWTDYENADGIALLEESQRVYVNTNGFKPDCIAMSNDLMRHLMRQRTTIERGRQSLGLAQVGSVSVAMLKEIMLANNLPPIVEYDELYQEEFVTEQQNAGTNEPYIKNTRFLNNDRFVFLKEGVGEQAIGTPLEAKVVKEGVISGNNSPVMVRVFEKTTVPILDVMQSISLCLPVVYNPKVLFSQKVA
jgi:hypothetical protein